MLMAIRNGAFLPKTIQMDWCICSIRDNFKAEKVSSIFIKTGEPLSYDIADQTLSNAGVSN